MEISILLCCALLVFSNAGVGNAAIFVQQNGVNELECITNRNDESRACKTLDYALTEIAYTETLTGDVTIIVEYSHGVNTLDIKYGFHLNITVIGAGLPNILCNNKKDFLRFTAHKDIPSAISFDGITFTNCYGFYNETSFEWITGYSFVNFDIVSLKNAYIIDSSDVIFTENRKVVISKCTFEYNIFRYGQVFFKVSNDFQRNISHNIISDSSFKQNTALNDSLDVFGTVASVISNFQSPNFVYSLLISNCKFQKNYYFIPETDDSGVSEVVVYLHSNSDYSSRVVLHTMNITIERSMFNNNLPSISYLSNSILIAMHALDLNVLEINLASNTFSNNTFMDGAEKSILTAIHLSNVMVTLTTAKVRYAFNEAFDNTGSILGISCYNISNPVGVLIEWNNFTRNHGKGVVSVTDTRSTKLKPSQLTVVDNTFHDNTVALSTSADESGGIMAIVNFQMNLGDSMFTNNTGTGLNIKNVHLTVAGTVEFTRNAGVNGGGLSINGASGLVTATDLRAKIIFNDNVALYGGGAYLSIPSADQNKESFCESFINSNCDFVFEFSNNRASSSGNDVYFEQNTLPECVADYIDKCLNRSTLISHGFGSCATSIIDIYGNSNDGNMLRIFPGQNVIINSTVIDAFDQNSTCVATVFLQCDNQVISCQKDNQLIQLEGPTLVTLGIPAYSSSIKLLASRNITNNTFNSPSLRFQCDYTPQYTLNLDIIPCPLGFEYNETTCACQCAFQSHDGYLCSVPHGKACVAKGYWLGLVKNPKQDNRYITVIARCEYLTCQRNAIQCPDDIGQGSSSYVLVGSTENEQCQQNHGGITCTSCREGATFSFEGILCVDNDKCQVWQPYVLLILVIVFQFVLAYLIQLFLTIQTTKGIGFLIGPLFYLAVANTLPFSYFKEYYHLKTLISTFSSFFLLNMELFGLIEWCFFSSFSGLDNYAFHYLGPLIVAVVLISTVLIAQRCPKWQTKLYVHPIKAICLLLLQSFWSLSDVIVRILQIEDFPGDDSYRVAIQPDLEYFTGSHIIYATISILIGVTIIYPLTLLLLLAPLISKKISLYRLKPLLDEFQSSYKDVFRWFPGIYMVCWLIIIGARREAIIMQTVLALMLATFFIMQPYASKWLNIANSLLLFDLIMVDALLNEQNNSYYRYSETLWVKPVFVFLIYSLTILPLLYITISGVCIVIVRFKIHHMVRNIWVKRRFFRADNNEADMVINQDSDECNLVPASTSFPVIHQSLAKERSQRLTKQMVHMVENKESDRNEYREPLILLLQEDDATTSYGSDK